jgi:quinol monooxygenase YgiN
MRLEKYRFILLLMALSIISCNQESKKDKYESRKGEMMVRIAAIEIEPNYLKEYIAILKKEAEASVRLEPGVICIYPMFQKENPTQIRLLEIYANKEAYASHLQTPHFKHYKETTLEMVKDLKLIDMEAIDVEMMSMIFRKLE